VGETQYSTARGAHARAFADGSPSDSFEHEFIR
jgi:hypothetical protein